MTNQQLPTPGTHQTRAGNPWRYLDLKGQDNAIAILMSDGKEYGFFFDTSPDSIGTYKVFNGLYMPMPEFDLVRKPTTTLESEIENGA